MVILNYNMAQGQDEKRRSACDECRNRKLKCSGVFPICERCQEENIQCVYSPQKRMGRPRKRARNDVEAEVEAPPDEYAIPTPDVSIADITTPSYVGLSQLFQIDTSGIDHSGLDYLQSSVPQSQQFLPLDPNLPPPDINTGQQPYQPDPAVPNAPCTCLSNMFLTLSNLQAEPNFEFPIMLPPMRAAVATTKEVLLCRICPTQLSTAMQNIMLLTTLLTSITDGYRKLLLSIDKEAQRCIATGEKKSYRVGDASPRNSHLHTPYMPDCPMGFHVELDGEEWRMLGRKVVKADVHGTSTDSAANEDVERGRSVLGLADLLEERQLKWHSDKSMAEMNNFHRNGLNGVGTSYDSGGPECTPKDGEFSCMKLVGMVRRHVELLGL